MKINKKEEDFYPELPINKLAYDDITNIIGEISILFKSTRDFKEHKLKLKSEKRFKFFGKTVFVPYLED